MRLRQAASLLKAERIRGLILSAVTAWNRHQLARILYALILAWVMGALGLYLSERRQNPNFSSFGESLWNVWVLLFSGVEESPKTTVGRIITMLVLITGVGAAGLFTASVASLLVERYLRRRDVSRIEMEGHLVLCNWSPRGLAWIQEVHARFVSDKRPVVIIHDAPEEIELPDKQDDAAFHDVYIVKGDPTSEAILRRAKVSTAHSVVVLTDDREGRYGDGKSILICIAIGSVCRGNGQPNISVECSNPANRNHLRKAGADEIISSDELGLKLLARSALFHGMTRVYQELLTVGRDANEMYLLPAPQPLVGKDFVELSGMFARHRIDRKSCLLIGIQRDDEMHVNPIAGEAGPLRADDQLILLCRVLIKPSDGLPTIPPVPPREESS